MSISSWLEAMTVKAAYLIERENVRFVGWTNSSTNKYCRLYYQYGQFETFDYILADPLIANLSVEQILNDGIVFKLINCKGNFLTIEDIGKKVLGNI